MNRYLNLLLDPAALRAFLTWPVFSITSFQMVSSLARQGIHPRTIVDVGANVGQFAIAGAKIFPDAKVYSFEPLPEAAASLKHRALPNMHVINAALGEKIGRAGLRVNSHTQSSSLLALGDTHLDAFPDEKEVRCVDVEMTTLDSVSIDLVPPVLLKLDVQGYETMVLAGAKRTLERCDYVVIEMSMTPMYEGETTFTDMLALMHDYGFRFLRPVGWLAHPQTGAILQMDGLFARS